MSRRSSKTDRQEELWVCLMYQMHGDSNSQCAVRQTLVHMDKKGYECRVAVWLLGMYPQADSYLSCQHVVAYHSSGEQMPG